MKRKLAAMDDSSRDVSSDSTSSEEGGTPSSSSSSETSKTLANPATPLTPEEEKAMLELQYQLSLLPNANDRSNQDELRTTPIFTADVLKHSPTSFPQYGLLAGTTSTITNTAIPTSRVHDPRLFFNTSDPSSTFICGSQGSGKSHTLSVLLETCLLPSRAALLPSPLSALVLHYDTFVGNSGGQCCEAAYLATNPAIKVKVLCAPTSLRAIRNTYAHLPHVTVSPLQIRANDLNTQRMLDLMAAKPDDGPLPLYFHVIYRVLRELRLEQQEVEGKGFDYGEFKRRVLEGGLTPMQLSPLNQRLDTLESFMPREQVVGKGGELSKKQRKAARAAGAASAGNEWICEPGTLTIIDLSCPCVTPESACSLFSIFLSLFLSSPSKGVGKIIALDEAHKYLTSSPESETLTNTLLSTIRLQRHLGARIIVSTQEPTVSPKWLDLCTTTIVHRFSSPDWVRCLRGHLAGCATDGVNSLLQATEPENDGCLSGEKGDRSRRIFAEIVNLRVGEALVFSPSAAVGMLEGSDGAERVKRLGAGYLKVRVRTRLTEDGGKSVLAV